MKESKGATIKIDSRMKERIGSVLPFKLTEAQRKVVKEIFKDMRSDAPMNRLLQGDVGSGKTIVALIAMLAAMENGYQTALMVPTEILAEQHARNIKRITGPGPLPNRIAFRIAQRLLIRNACISRLPRAKFTPPWARMR